MSDIVFAALNAVRMLIGDDVSPELMIVSSPGSSGARIAIVRHADTGSLYAVKCASHNRVSLFSETARRDILEPFLAHHLPTVLWCGIIDGFEVMITECRGFGTLHSVVMSSEFPHSVVRSLWREILGSMLAMWTKSAHQFQGDLSPRYHPERVKRIRSGIESKVINGIRLADVLHLPTVVNGRECLSIYASLQTAEAIQPPAFGVICHGDPQPSNVIVDHRLQWSLIDWEWSGRNHDWRMMFSHLYGWWSSRCIGLDDQPFLEIADGHLVLTCRAFLPRHIESYQHETYSLFTRIQRIKGTIGNEYEINKFLSLLYFGELRFLKSASRDCFAVPMLTAGIEAAHSSIGESQFASLFSFNPQEMR